MRRAITGLVAVILLLSGALASQYLSPRPVGAQSQFVIQQATGTCPTDPGKVALYPGLLCLILDTGTLYMFDPTGVWRQFVLLPAGVSTLTFPVGSTITSPVLSGATVVSGSLSINGIGLAVNGGYISTGGQSLAFSGDYVFGVSTAPTIGPGFGKVTLRARRSLTFPGACQLWAIAGSASVETAIGPPIPGNC
jgi:hypothetical protein